jgi:hypothetical protein
MVVLTEESDSSVPEIANAGPKAFVWRMSLDSGQASPSVERLGCAATDERDAAIYD